ncbi:hypothetical protein F383_14791 [Gossypium arboreum]|uniref:Uncharacterized protein n=1 Tax=Gossypium arboreum TaxID=29729 RepID=A0A0B0N6B5_GOSAR|nr:hypothetical protein F383_35529 [Gossypium arboreum]KHG11011.1 hypothetical protein F383_14791 [Gossypium arboreum]
MPLSYVGSYSHTYIGVTYRCQRVKCSLTCTHISKSHIDANVLNAVLLAHIYWNPMS